MKLGNILLKKVFEKKKNAKKTFSVENRRKNACICGKQGYKCTQEQYLREKTFPQNSMRRNLP